MGIIPTLQVKNELVYTRLAASNILGGDLKPVVPESEVFLFLPSQGPLQEVVWGTLE